MDRFTAQIIHWSRNHGRKALPWQQRRSPYRVWVAEIMLQQTQVATVIKHYDRFHERFPDVVTLQQATRDEILSAWYGLGYYRRAVNMHEAACIVVKKYAGKFPKTVSELCSLPGIGRSTAGSILASAWNIPAPILDANVRRVLSRYHGVNGSDSKKSTEGDLWLIAESHTPQLKARIYNQAIMDFGATWCTLSDPQCTRCPISPNCAAYQLDQVAEFPAKKSRSLAHLTTIRPCVVFDKNFACLLRQRGSSGLYATMWDTPDLAKSRQPRAMLRQLQFPTKGVNLLVDVSSGSYRISNQKITEELTIAKYHVASHELGTPANMHWKPFRALSGIGLSVRTMQRIELAKALVESK